MGVFLIVVGLVVVGAVVLFRALQREHAQCPSLGLQQPISEPSRREEARSAPSVAAPATAAVFAVPVFAVVDVETTGFAAVPSGEDRIVEVAVVRVGIDGQVLDEYVTLVNPNRRMGASHVHGITGTDVEFAPSFDQIVADVGERLAGTVLVAHNGKFDLRFLRGEFEAAGVTMPEVPMLCTLELAYRYMNVPCRKLGFLCEELGIKITEHTALGDARATAGLLGHFSKLADGRLFDHISQPGDTLEAGWTGRQASGLRVPRSNGQRSPAGGAGTLRAVAPAPARTAPGDLMAKLLGRLPDEGVESANEAVYLNQLEKVVADREITLREVGSLYRAASKTDLSSAQVAALNRRFLRGLVASAKADDVLTDLERQDLARVAELLRISHADLEADLVSTPAAPAPPPPAAVSVRAGQAVCFLGDFASPLQELTVQAERGGLVVRKNITKAVGLVVTSGPAAEAGRQARARSLGIPVVSEHDFLSLLSQATG